MAFTCRQLPSLFTTLLCIMLLPFSVVSQNQIFNVGATLSATINSSSSSSWLSPSGDFAFGFQQLQSPKGTFLLCIWYAKISDNTIVWYANKDAPAAVGSTVAITSDRGLVLKDPLGKELWNSESIVRKISHGFMNDSGNFQLMGSDSEVLWQSFQNPTDTLLPSQVIPMDDRRLTSRRSETNFSNGRFQLRFQGDGNLVLYSVNLPTDKLNAKFYESGTFDGTNSSNAGKELIFGESGYIYMTKRGGGIVNLTTAEEKQSPEDYYYRATLNFDGVFILYRHPKRFDANQTWSSIWFEPTDICRYPAPLVAAGSGACGYNSICRLKIDSRPTCGCPIGYALADPNDPYGDCVPNFHLSSCAADEPYNRDLYEIVRLANVDFPSMDYSGFNPYSEEQCQEACLSDCMCDVAVFDSNNCWKKGLPLSYGRSDLSLKPITYFKVGKRPFPIPPVTPNASFPDKDDDNQGTIILAGSVLLGGSVLINLILLGGVCFAFFFIYSKKIKQGGSSAADTNLRCFTFKELSDATNEFKEELGRGASGIVYKGKIQAGSGAGATFVAIKKLDRVVENDKEFKTEMNIIGQTHHKNLVRLLGFCHEGSNRLLVYEFLSNGSLASLLFGDLRPSWSQRIQIAFGISRGLVYLHEECATQIIHCDIKPQNILLDDYYSARISDFGLSKLLTLDQSQTQTAIRGTKGYVAPEWFRCTPVTTKVDVYSFGVLLLEIICCRKCVQQMGPDSYGTKTILTDWAYDCYREGTLRALVEDDVEALNDLSRVEKFVMVALWCIQEEPQLRPSMRSVTQMLEGVVEVKVPHNPSPYSYYAVDDKEQLQNADEVSLIQN